MIRGLRPQRRPGGWLALWLAMLVAVAAGSLWPAGDLPGPAWPGLDKLQHVVGHGLLSAYAAMLFAAGRARAFAVLALVLFGVGIEAAQDAFTTSRHADAADVLANLVGLLCGQLVALTPAADLLVRADRRLRA